MVWCGVVWCDVMCLSCSISGVWYRFMVCCDVVLGVLRGVLLV